MYMIGLKVQQPRTPQLEVFIFWRASGSESLANVDAQLHPHLHDLPSICRPGWNHI
jgi:hypothetical protein